ncbi:sugar-binding transcriptional regulator [Thalassorhabdomicrobium marinisediminis]|uniref:sugar-binding transcriptional regulator n=1 Tax=Thalassorhabdomicrobium marinisediminis TaxID=2170577 RepID=UPI002490EE8B|nr:sugar-binding transcriptional regulator [Thalassorhabdomicrobium marinisediminis]
MSTIGPDPELHRLIAEILTLHYKEDMLQSEIATKLGLSSAKVNRLIKRGRALGMVQITINSPFLHQFELERELTDRWELKNCLVVPTVAGNPAMTLDHVGDAAGRLLLKSLADGNTIAISGGKALSAMVANLPPDQEVDVEVVPMTGGVQGHHYTDVNHIATGLADRLAGHATLIHAPLHAETEAERDLVMSLKSVREVMDMVRVADVAVFGIGSVTGGDSTYYDLHPVGEADRKELYRKGVRGELLGHLIDGSGQLADTALNSCLVALPPQDVAHIPVSIGVASGVEKAEPVIAALNGGYLNSFVTDEDTATAILEQSDKKVKSSA